MSKETRFSVMSKIEKAIIPDELVSEHSQRIRVEALCGIAGSVFAAMHNLPYPEHPTMPQELAQAALDGMELWLEQWRSRN